MSEKIVLRAGLIGAGSSATNIAETLANTQGVKLTAISDVNIDLAKKIAQKYNVDIILKDYEDLCKRDDIDYVIISTPHALHAKMAIYALNHGKHVLCEKPIATTIKDAEEMIAVAKKCGKKLGIHFQNRFIGAVKKAKQLIDSGFLGKIIQVNISVMWFRPIEYYKDSPWRGKWALEGGGSLINQAIHPVDEMIYLVGDVKTVFGFKEPKYHQIETEDNTAAVFQFENGAFGTIQTSTSTKAAFPAKLTIFGVEGGLVIDGNILTIYKPDGTSETIDFNQGGQVGSEKDPKKFSLEAHGALMADFRDAILYNREPMINGEEGLRSLKIICGIYESDGKKIINL